MPEAEYLSNELDNDSFELYDEKNSIFNQFSFSDMNASQADLKLTVLKRRMKTACLRKQKTTAAISSAEWYQPLLPEKAIPSYSSRQMRLASAFTFPAICRIRVIRDRL